MKARVQTITHHKDERGRLVLNTKKVVLPLAVDKSGRIIRQPTIHVKPVTKRIYHAVTPKDNAPAVPFKITYIGRMKGLYKGMYK